VTTTSRVSGRRGGLLVGGGVAVVLIVVLVVLAGDEGDPVTAPPLSPRSVGPDGTRALVTVLGQLGADVQVVTGEPDARTTVALVLRDRLDSATRRGVQRYVQAGGALVVADPTSSLSPDADGQPGSPLARAQCDIEGLDDVASVRVEGSPPVELGSLPAARLYEVGTGDGSCVGDGDRAFVVRHRVGAGTITSVGGPQPFTNALLDDDDNAVLAARLLLPRPGARVALLDPNTIGRGDATLLDLVPSRVRQALIQVGIAFVLYALWRSRRLGRPVVETQPVAIAGSQLVRAVGELRQRAHAHDKAAATVRADLRRQLSQRYGLPSSAPAPVLAQVVADRTGLARDRVLAALDDRAVAGEPGLVALTRELDAIRQEVLDGHRR
jgi:hypothetical protein